MGPGGPSGSDGISPIGTVFTGNQKGCTEGGVEFVGANTTVVCNGKKGTNGTNGAPGKSVVIGSEPKGANCTEGGSNFEVEGSGTKKFACNGSPWTAGGTLPSGATETGSWSFGKLTAGSAPAGGCCIHVPISFPIPLSAELDESHVHFINKAGKEKVFDEVAEEIKEITSTVCLGTAVVPKASQGHLCVYTAYSAGATPEWEAEFPQLIMRASDPFEAGGLGASIAGSDFTISPVAAGDAARGTWAVTAP